jgi:hypothetical protein
MRNNRRHIVGQILLVDVLICVEDCDDG